MTPKCLNEVWKKLWPEVCSNVEKPYEETVIQNIAELAKDVGLEGINEDDAEELL